MTSRPCHGLILALLALLACTLPASLSAQVCTGGSIGWARTGEMTADEKNCVGTYACYAPQLGGVTYETAGCDPTAGACAVRAQVRAIFRGNHHNQTASPPYQGSPVMLTWTNGGGGFVGSCGALGAAIWDDIGDAWISAGNFSCDDPEAATGTGTYNLNVKVCNGATDCIQSNVNVPIALTPGAMAAALCDPPPLPMNCDAGDASCSVCLVGSGPGGTSVGGRGPGLGAPGTGPGAELVYQAGGTGNGIYPKPADWTATLGRFWSHDYAERIVQDPDDSHVVLLTRWATYREFTDADADDTYETASPSDEYRNLTQTASGWELRDLNGTVDHFDTNGRWTQRVDKNGNAKVATYNASQLLESVAFPDGRSESFTYAAGGKLETITEIGTDGTTSRTWTYTWTGDDLTRVDRPDGTAWRFEYMDALFPGHMTKLVLVGTDASERVEKAWSYDSEGNVEAFWRGADAPTDAGAVDVWQLAYDNPALPQVTTVTDPLGNTSVYTLGRDSSFKPRLASLSDSCPVCGVDPNSQMAYEDSGHPLLPTRQTDGDGTVTRFSYDANGRMTSQIEDFGGALEREATWSYDATYPMLVTEIVRPSVTGNPLDERVTSIVYDASGNEASRTVSGFEDGSPFNLVTVTTSTAQGRVDSVDPPGFGTGDVTSFTYDPARGNLVVVTQTEPLVGTTTYGYDAFNRRTSVTDPNGTIVKSEYDALDRVRFERRCGTVCEDGDDLVTEYVYDVFGDRFQMILPRGNVVEYGYDQAGRLTTVELKADTAPGTHGERAVYQYDGFGHRTREELQRWDGTQWVVDAVTGFEYSTRCYLDKTIAGDGTATESVTEYAYDCDGQLEQVWDANHPSAGQTTPATSVYGYDALNRLSSVTQPWTGTGGGSVVTSYTYDVQDHLASLTDGEGNETFWVYSDRDLMTSEVAPVSGSTSYTYNEHGQMATRTDARGVTLARTLDELGRATFVDYPDDTLDVAYAYDDPLVPFSLDRLTQILRDGHAVDYSYDQYGRTTQDGALTYGYDGNGNITEVGYPGGVAAAYTHDYADREATLDVEVPGDPVRSVVTSVSYYASGPLRSLTHGNGVMEARLYDSRYYPDRITATGTGTLLDWDYTTDNVGNPTSIVDVLNAANDRTYGYQAPQYFLTQGDGPWGSLAWTYDRTGNRLTEVRDGGPADFYTYLPNGAGGNDARLASIVLGAGGTRSYDYDAAGNWTDVTQGSEVSRRQYDSAARLSFIGTADGLERRFFYDGRGFLRAAERTPPIFLDGFESGNTACWSSVVGGTGGGTCTSQPQQVEAMTETTYSSRGILFNKFHPGPGGDAAIMFYFMRRPIAVLFDDGSRQVVYLGTDSVGTPIITTDDQMAEVWSGGFEPFGVDYNGALAANVFNRLPGQWADVAWADDGLLYNTHRWYDSGIGKYTRPDPFSKTATSFEHGALFGYPESAYNYARSNPLVFIDVLGLASQAECVAQWTAGGTALGTGIGAVAGAAGGGTACTFVAPGVGTVGCGAGGIAPGAAAGAAAGAATGAFLGGLLCPEDCPAERTGASESADDGAWQSCLNLYVQCVENPNSHKFLLGGRCDVCLRICRDTGTWPFGKCKLWYYA